MNVNFFTNCATYTPQLKYHEPYKDADYQL